MFICCIYIYALRRRQKQIVSRVEVYNIWSGGAGKKKSGGTPIK